MVDTLLAVALTASPPQPHFPRVRMRAVTVEDVRAFARERLGPDNRAVLTYEPKGEA